MANFTRLHHLYSFPGFVPAATIRGVFGDRFAVVIRLRRRRKKHAAVCAVPAVGPSTIKRCDESVISIAAADASTWNCPCDAFSVASAKP